MGLMTFCLAGWFFTIRPFVTEPSSLFPTCLRTEMIRTDESNVYMCVDLPRKPGRNGCPCFPVSVDITTVFPKRRCLFAWILNCPQLSDLTYSVDSIYQQSERVVECLSSKHCRFSLRWQRKTKI